MSVLFIFFIYEIFSLRLARPGRAEVCDENCGKSKSYAKNSARIDRLVGNAERGEAKTLRGCAAYSN